MCSADEDWVSAAMTDDRLVVDLLVRLQTAAAPPPPRKRLPLDWSVRQRRSRALSLLGNLKKETHRASPTTPLNWSGATSFSGGSGGGAGCYEEPSAGAASARSQGESAKANSKSSRRKKQTLSELREEESSLLKERRELKKEISRQRMRVEEQMEINEKLKRMKAQLQPLHPQESPSTAEASHQKSAPSPQIASPTGLLPHQPLPESRSKTMLPDLNIPFEDEARCPEVICGVS